jgi:hypothetical protein
VLELTDFDGDGLSSAVYGELSPRDLLGLGQRGQRSGE